jgi:uncharacterized protein
MSPLPDPWHFARDELAGKVLATLDSGVVNAITLFAPRRMGKTQFAVTDLAPLAARQGWIVAYCNLWSDKPNPAGVLVAALDAAEEPFRPGKKSAKVGVSANLGIVTANAEATQEISPKAAPSQISEAFARVAGAIARKAKGRRLLLIVDEVQHLASDPRFEPAAAALRTALEQHAARVRCVFTGSSQSGLQRLFLDSKAAFFSPGGQMQLPPLGDDFVRFMVERANKTFRTRIAFGEAKAIFEASGRSPYFLRQVITVAMLREVSLADALNLVIEETLNEEGIARRWSALNEVDRAVALAVHGGKAPFAAASLEELGKAVKGEVRASNVQVSLRKLERDGLVERAPGGGYAVTDPMVAIWLARVGGKP